MWTGAAIYRRFHPACAASFILRVDAAESSQAARGSTDIVEGYADGWRALPDGDDSGGVMGRPNRAVNAARQWLMSQDPSAWPSLRGDVFATVTIVENGQKKAVPGLSHEQVRQLQTHHRWHPSPVPAEDGEDDVPEGNEEHLECAICLAEPTPGGPPCIVLPCAPQHVFHESCALPWLRKASLCPVCRKDVRPLLGCGPGSSTAKAAR